MRVQNGITICEIEWGEPCSVLETIRDMNRVHDHGIYQFYGTHAVFGPDALLYIGKAERQTFGDRVAQHLNKKWMAWEPDAITVSLGRLGGADLMHEKRWDEWDEMISRAEKLLIWYSTPPYNGRGFKEPAMDEIQKMPPTVVLNFRRRRRIPFEVSNLEFCADINYSSFKLYGTQISSQ